MGEYYDYDGNPISVEEWSVLFAGRAHEPEIVRWKVAQTEITDAISVSTVWLGLDHNFSGEGPPLIFESLIFGGNLDGEGRRYATEADAIQGHEALVELAQADLAIETK